MRVIEHDPEREAPPQVEPPAIDDPVLVFTPFRVVKFGHGHELRIDLARKGDSVSVSCRHWASKGRGKPAVPGHPMHVFPEYLPALIAGLAEAAAAIGVEIPATSVHHVDTSGGALPPFLTGRVRGATSPENPHE